MPPRRRTLTHNSGNQNNQNRTNPEEPQTINVNELLELLRQQTATLAQQQQLLQQQHQQLLQQQQPPNPPAITFKTFQAVKPPEFQGTHDPVEAQIWLKEVEKAFDLVNVGDEQKVGFATYLLKGEANYWWESAKALAEAAGEITWEEFKRIFLEKYYPRYMRTQMELKFFELKQENMSVAEYEKKFTELARFVGDFVDTEEKRARRFQ